MLCRTIQNSIGDILVEERGGCDYIAGTDQLVFSLDDVSIIPIPRTIAGNMVDVQSIEFGTFPLTEVENDTTPPQQKKGFPHRVTL